MWAQAHWHPICWAPYQGFPACWVTISKLGPWCPQAKRRPRAYGTCCARVCPSRYPVLTTSVTYGVCYFIIRYDDTLIVLRLSSHVIRYYHVH